MHSLRRGAVRGVSVFYSPPVVQFRSSFLGSRLARQSVIATNDVGSPRNERISLRSFSSTSGRRRDDEPSTLDTAKETAESAAQSVKETASSAADSVGRGINSITPDAPASSAQTSPIRSERFSPVEREPSKTLYVGNLYFEVTPEALREEFGRIGEVTDSKIVYDGRGLSKGFGYITFSSQDAADNAKATLDSQVFEGRKLAVQYAKGSMDRNRESIGRPKNPPGKTIFIGNMSYEMSDKDLNDLFREIKNVVDVRVAIDRRTGQPRGFAHADFMDVASAEKAAALLQSKTFYGRNLRIDYSTSRADLPPRPSS